MCLVFISFFLLINVLGMWVDDKVDFVLEKLYKVGIVIYINVYYFKKK